MKQYRLAVTIAFFYMALSLSSCVVVDIKPIRLLDKIAPLSASSNPVGSRVGQASGNSFFEVFTFGTDVSIRRAAKNGGITRIATVDFRQSDYLGLVQAYTCIVTGE